MLFEPVDEQGRHIDPARIVAHLGRSLELEGLALDVEPQARERPLRSPGRTLAACRGTLRTWTDALLSVEYQDSDALGSQACASNGRALSLNLPGPQATNR